MTAAATPALRFVALGGLGAIGMNCAVFEYGDDLLVLDCGVSFPDSDHFGVDVVIPDFDWLIERAERIVGVVITHGHQDHIGALPHLLAELDVPVYAPRFALGLIKEALREHELLEATELFEISDRRRVKLGAFELELIRVNHSIPDTFAVAMRTPLGLFVHTADFKIDFAPPYEPPADLHRFAELGREGVRALFSDSTNAERPGFAGSEATVARALDRIVTRADGRVFVTMFSTNVFRVQAAIDVAERTGRRIVLLGRSLQKCVEVARDAGCLRIPSMSIFANMDEWGRLPRHEVLALCTGSQAQPRSALPRIAQDDYRPVRLEPGDLVVFSARAIPGNERIIARMKDDIARQGAHVVEDADVHVSGHACRDEQRLMLRLLQPQELVPVHGDYRYQVTHAETAAAMGVARAHVLANGDVLEFTKHDSGVVDHIALSARHVDSDGAGVVDEEGMRARRRLGRAGLIVASVVLDASTREIVDGPTLLNRGAFDSESEADGVLERARVAVADAIGSLDARRQKDDEQVAEVARAAIRRTMREEFAGRKPVVEVVVHTRR